jgi:hypothetical protein
MLDQKRAHTGFEKIFITLGMTNRREEQQACDDGCNSEWRQ